MCKFPLYFNRFVSNIKVFILCNSRSYFTKEDNLFQLNKNTTQTSSFEKPSIRQDTWRCRVNPFRRSSRDWMCYSWIIDFLVLHLYSCCTRWKNLQRATTSITSRNFKLDCFYMHEVWMKSSRNFWIHLSRQCWCTYSRHMCQVSTNLVL